MIKAYIWVGEEMPTVNKNQYHLNLTSDRGNVERNMFLEVDPNELTVEQKIALMLDLVGKHSRLDMYWLDGTDSLEDSEPIEWIEKHLPKIEVVGVGYPPPEPLPTSGGEDA